MSMNSKKYVKPVVNCGPSRTKQSFAKECDINQILARYRKTGLLDHVRANPGVFADVSKIEDFHGMTQKIRFAQESFEQLPADLRNRFNNDPGRLIAFVADKSNIDEAIKLGILPQRKEDAVKALKAAPKEPKPAVVPPEAEPAKPVSKKP